MKLKESVKELNTLKASNDQLKTSLKGAQLDILSSGDEAFEKAKAQALILQPNLTVDAMDFFKIVCDGQLMDPDEETVEIEAESMFEKNDKEPPVEQPEHHPGEWYLNGFVYVLRL